MAGMTSFNLDQGKTISKSRHYLVVVAILVTEMCERLTYYSIIANLPLFCTSNLGIRQTTATTVNQVFGGFVYIIPIFGGFLSDSYFGRFKTILFSCMLYLIGLVLIPVAAIDFDSWGWDNLDEEGKRVFFFLGLTFVALGTGGIKANVGPFGAEQVQDMGKDAVQSFFNWFYWVINVGSFIAFAGVAYIQQEISFAWGFFVPLASMVVSVVVFVAVKSFYIRTEPKGSILVTAWQISSAGCCKSRPAPNPSLPEDSEKKMLARAKKSFGGIHEDHVVDGLGSVLKVIPFTILVVMYWAIYSQMSNTFFAQAERMNVSLGGTKIPAAALNVFNTLSIILLIPLIDRGLYPCMEKIGHPLTYLKRIGIGMVFAVFGIVVAGVIEIYRKEVLETDGVVIQDLAGESFNASSMSVLMQIPQFALIGVSEIFTSITCLEFAYNQAPVSMQGLLTGLFLASSGIGNWVATAFLAIVEAATVDDPWWGDEINNTKMENMLFLLGGLMVVNVLVFCVVAKNYQYQDPSTFEVADTDTDEEKEWDGDKKRGGPYQTFAEETPPNDNDNKMTPYP